MEKGTVSYRELRLQGGSWSFWMASAGTLSVGSPPGPSCPPQITAVQLLSLPTTKTSVSSSSVASSWSSSYCTSSQHSTPLSPRNPFSWFWPSFPAFQTVPPIHIHLEFLSLPFICVLVQQRVQSQLDTSRRKRLPDLCPWMSPVGLYSR